MACYEFTKAWTRRGMLGAAACGLGQLALWAMADEQAQRDVQSAGLGRGIPAPHFPPRAKRIIFLFMWGGPSHVDLFDPKPRLNEEDGKPLAGKTVGSDKEELGTLL